MNLPEDSIDPVVRELINHIASAAVVYGYLQGFERGACTALQAGAAASLPSAVAREIQLSLAREAAEAFVTKVYVEQATRP